jgi:hypothetical protein
VVVQFKIRVFDFVNYNTGGVCTATCHWQSIKRGEGEWQAISEGYDYSRLF